MAEPEADNLRLAQNNNEEVDLSDETQDFRFLSIFSKSDNAAPIPKRGEKDFLPDGTTHQTSALDDSRAAMIAALQGERKHSSKTHVDGIWRPAQQRCEILHHKGPHFKTVGRADSNGTTWLLPEETIYMVERGALECWWEEGVPMGLQGVYACCTEAAGGIERVQVYGYLKRAGYILQRADTFWEDDDNDEDDEHAPAPLPLLHPSTAAPPGIFATLFSSLFAPRPHPDGPLLPNAVYRSYPSIFPRLALIPAHHPVRTAAPVPARHARAPFRVAYNVWKPVPAFKKSDPPPPDFRLAVVAARDRGVPTLEELAGLVESLPLDPKAADRTNPFARLKEGYRNVVVAVVDSGVTSFLKIADVGFADEKMFERRQGGRGKYSGRGRGGARGRGGRGRGQGGRGA